MVYAIIIKDEKMSESIATEGAGLDSEFVVNAVIRLMKRDILERYKQTGAITDEDWSFCEKIDWHPADELPLREDFVESIRTARSERSVKLKSVSEIFE